MKMYKRQRKNKKGKIFALLLALMLVMAPAFESYASMETGNRMSSAEKESEDSGGQEDDKEQDGTPKGQEVETKDDGTPEGQEDDKEQDGTPKGQEVETKDDGTPESQEDDKEQDGTSNGQEDNKQTERTAVEEPASQMDSTKPEIKNIELENNGKTVKNDTKLTLTLQVYDDSPIDLVAVELRAEDSAALGSYNQYRRTVQMECAEITEGSGQKEHTYVCTYQLDGVVTGKVGVSSIRVVDKYSNSTYSSYSFNNSGYWVNAEGTESGTVRVKSFDFPKNKASSESLSDITEGMKLETENPIDVGGVILCFRGGEHNTTNYITLGAQPGRDSYSVFDIPQSDDYFYSGMYALTDVFTVRGDFSMKTSLTMEDKENYYFTITEKEDSGTNTPEPEVQLSLNAVEVEKNGQNIEQGESIALTVSAASDGDDLPAGASIEFRAAASDIDKRSTEVSLELGEDGKYHGTLDTEGLYLCEWYIYRINIGAKWFYQDSFPDAGNSPYYIRVCKDQNFVNPTRDWTIEFYVLDESGKYQLDHEINKEDVERRQTLKEAGITLPENVSSNYPGLQFKGWMDEDGRDITENTQLVDGIGFGTIMRVYAKYDKGIQWVHFNYLNAQGKWNAEFRDSAGTEDTASRPVVFERGQTYAQILDGIKDYKPEDMTTGYQFSGWKLSSYEESDVVDDAPDFFGSRVINVTAEYKDATILRVKYNYTASNGGNNYGQGDYFAVKKGITVGEAIKELKKSEKPELYEGLRFKEWEVQPYFQANDTDTVKNGQEFALTAVYENCLVRYAIYYYKNVGGVLYTYTDYFCQVAEKGDTLTALTSFGDFKDISWTGSTPPAKFVVTGNMSFSGWGTRSSSKPDDSTEPSDTSKPSSGSSSNGTSGSTAGTTSNPVFNETSGTQDNPYVTPESKLPDSVVTSAVEAVNAAIPGQTVRINMNTSTTVSKEILEAARGKDINVTLEMDGYSWTINGRNIQSTNLQDINLQVIKNTDHIPSSTIRSLAGNNPYMQLTLVHEGNFGFQATLNIGVGAEYSGKYGNLYYHDSAGKMVFMNAGRIDSNGYVSLSFSHASDYLLVMSDEMMSQASVPSQLMPSSPEQVQSGEIVSVSADVNSVKSVKTGDNDMLYPWMLLCFTAAGIMIIIYQFKKKQV